MVGEIGSVIKVRECYVVLEVIGGRGWGSGEVYIRFG